MASERALKAAWAIHGGRVPEPPTGCVTCNRNAEIIDRHLPGYDALLKACELTSDYFHLSAEDFDAKYPDFKNADFEQLKAHICSQSDAALAAAGVPR